MRKTVAMVLLLLSAGPAPAQDKPARLPAGARAALHRHGCGNRLHEGHYEVRVAKDRIEIRGEEGRPSFLIVGERVLARRPGSEEWTPVSAPADLLFPELRGPETRYVASGDASAGLVPREEADRKLVVSVKIRRQGTFPRSVVLSFPGSGREVREYSGWKEEPPPAPAGPEASKGKPVAWPPEDEWGSRLEEALAKVQLKLGKLTDLSGRFTREKHTILLARPSVARGRFLFVPGRLLWIDEEPRESQVLITRERMEIHDPANKRLERFLFGDSGLGKYVFLGFGESLAEGLRTLDPVAFDGEGETLRLTLEPVATALAERLTRLVLVLDAKEGYLREMSYEDPTGDSVVTRLSDLEKNTGIDPGKVDIRPAEGTQIVTNEGGGPWR
jgi:outer membrane lipoprotein-sorting protein